MTKTTRKHTTIAMIVYLVLLLWLVLFKLSLSLYEIPKMRSINLVPFMESQNWDGTLHIKEILANILVFLPFGYFIKRQNNTLTILQVSVAGFGLSFLLEILQYTLGTGASDITDIITNTLGALLGTNLFLMLRTLLSNRRLWLVDAFLLICMLGLILFIFYLRWRGIFIWHYL